MEFEAFLEKKKDELRRIKAMLNIFVLQIQVQIQEKPTNLRKFNNTSNKKYHVGSYDHWIQNQYLSLLKRFSCERYYLDPCSPDYAKKFQEFIGMGKVME